MTFKVDNRENEKKNLFKRTAINTIINSREQHGRTASKINPHQRIR